MFNNDLATQVCHAYEASTKSVTVLAGRDYKPGEQARLAAAGSSSDVLRQQADQTEPPAVSNPDLFAKP